MKKWFKKLILFFIFALITMQNAFCYVLEQNELNNILLNRLNISIKQELKKYNISDLKINIYGLPSEKIVTNENVKPKVEIISQNNSFQPSEYKRVIIKNSKGNTIKAFAINVQTKVYKEVLVSDNSIKFNEEITSANTKLIKTEISKNIDSILTSIPNNCISIRNFPKGTLITKNSIKQKAVISKNSIVDIKFLSSKGLEIKLQGKALKDGAIGENILVKSDKYNKTYNAIVSSPQEVLVRI